MKIILKHLTSDEQERFLLNLLDEEVTYSTFIGLPQERADRANQVIEAIMNEVNSKEQ